MTTLSLWDRIKLMTSRCSYGSFSPAIASKDMIEPQAKFGKGFIGYLHQFRVEAFFQRRNLRR